jgi:hypothetical protein
MNHVIVFGGKGGDRMNKKILGIFVSLLVVAMLATPVMAEPTKGQKVAAELYPQALPYYEGIPEKNWTTNGGITQERGGQTDYYPIDLKIGSALYTDGYSTNINDVVSNSKTSVVNIRSDTVWTFAGIGGFAGNIEMKLWFVEGMPMPYYSIHTLMHGFGDFEGQTLMLSYDGKLMGAVWKGYCLKG